MYVYILQPCLLPFSKCLPTITLGVSKRLLSPSDRPCPLLRARDSPIYTTSLRILHKPHCPHQQHPFTHLANTLSVTSQSHCERLTIHPAFPMHRTTLHYNPSHPVYTHPPIPSLSTKNRRHKSKPSHWLSHSLLSGGIDPPPTSATCESTSHAGKKRHGPRATGSVCKATTPQRRMMHGR